MDLTPLIHDPALAPTDYASALIGRFQSEVQARIAKLLG
jgi:hypothetical protein